MASHIASDNDSTTGIASLFPALHDRSHGQSFLSLMESRFLQPGLYLMDEPESALSFHGQLQLLRLIHHGVASGSQFVLATHSPVLMRAEGRPSSSSTTQGCIGSSTTTSLRSPCGADSWPIRRPCSQSSMRMTTDPAIQEGPAWFGALFGQRRGPVPRVVALGGRVRRSIQVVRAAGQPLVAVVAPGAAPPGPPPLGPPPMPAAACWMTLPPLSAPGPRPPGLRVCAALRPRR